MRKWLLINTCVIGFTISYFHKPVMAMPEKNLELELKIWTAEPREFPQLEREATRLIQLNSKSSFAHYLVGHLYIRMFAENPTNMSLLRKASEMGQQAIELNPEKDHGHIVISEILDSMGQPENALKVIDKSLNPSLNETWRTTFLRAKLLGNKLKHKEVIELLNKSMHMDNAQWKVVVPYVIAHLQSELEGEILVSEIEKWYKRFPSDLFLLSLAINYSNRREYLKAHKTYLRILAKNKYQPESLINDGMLLYKHLNQPNKASKNFKSALKNSKLNHKMESIVHVHLGFIEMDRLKFKNSRENFRQAVKKAINKNEIVDYIVKNIQQKEKWNEFEKVVEILNEEFPGNSILYALLGEVQSSKLGKHKSAIESFNSAIVLEPSRSDYYNGLGLTYYRLKKYRAAIQYFRQAVAIDPQDATAQYNEACMLSLLGNTQESLSSLYKALLLNPSLAEKAKGDPDFNNIKTNKIFVELISGGKPEISH